MSGDAGPFPLQPVVQERIVLAELCGRYGPPGCICHFDRGHIRGYGGAEPHHSCGHCDWTDAECITSMEADARLLATATARGTPAWQIDTVIRIGPVDRGEGRARTEPLRRVLDQLGETP